MSEEVKADVFGFFSLFALDVDESEETELRNDCEKFGVVTRIHRKGGTSRNVFVRFGNKEQAERALCGLKNKWKIMATDVAKGFKRLLIPNGKESKPGCLHLKNVGNEKQSSGKKTVRFSLPDDNSNSDQKYKGQNRSSPLSQIKANRGKSSEVERVRRELQKQIKGNEHRQTKFSFDDSDGNPFHLDEILVCNLSDKTTADDLMKVFAPLQPLSVSEPTYAFLIHDGPCRIVRFKTMKAVTFALQHFQSAVYLHGKLLSLHRHLVLEIF